MNVRSVFIFIFVVVALATRGQQTDLFMGSWHANRIEQEVVRDQKKIHLSSKPLIVRADRDSLALDMLKDSSKYYSQLTAHIMRDHLFVIKGRDYAISGDLLLNYGVGEEFRTDSTEYLYSGQRGFVIQASIGKRFRFNSGFYEVQNRVPEYLNLFVEQNGVFPGWGRVKDYDGGDFDFGKTFGCASFDVSNSVQAHFGYGNHFIGNGYRSLIMSDGIMNSPYLELDWKSRDGIFQYRTWWENMQSLERLPLGDTPESLFKRKSAHFHYISVMPIPGLEVGIFEGMVSKRNTDSTIVKLGWQDFQPIIGINTMLEGWDGESNVYAGLNISYGFKNASIYGQYLIDDPATRRTGFQIGAKVYDVFIKGLQVRLEWNQTERFTYAARKDLTGLNQFNQPFGHPLGGGVREWLGIAEYRYRRYFCRLKYNSIIFDTGEGGDWQVESISSVDGVMDHVNQMDTQLGLQLNLHTNAEVYVNYVYRDGTYNSHFFMLGIRTNLHNNYFDF